MMIECNKAFAENVLCGKQKKLYEMKAGQLFYNTHYVIYDVTVKQKAAFAGLPAYWEYT